MTVSGNSPFEGGDHLSGTYIPGTYTVEIKAWADNNVDTGVTTSITVTIVDPCDGAAINVLSAIVTSDPIPYKIYDPADVQTLVATEGVTVNQAE